MLENGVVVRFLRILEYKKMVLKSYIFSTKIRTIFKLKNKLKLVLNERYILLTDINVVHIIKMKCDVDNKDTIDRKGDNIHLVSKEED